MKKNLHYYCLGLSLTALLIWCLPACNADGIKEIMPVKKQVTKAKNDSALVRASIAGFLNWYRINYTKANAFPFLDTDRAGYFAVNEKAYTAYLDFLSSSQLVSPGYIEKWKNFFVDKTTALKKNKIKSDIPDGFDLDLVLITQEPEIILNKIDSIQYHITSMNDSMAVVALKLPSNSAIEYKFEMLKATRGWQVDYISTPNFD